MALGDPDPLSEAKMRHALGPRELRQQNRALQRDGILGRPRRRDVMRPNGQGVVPVRQSGGPAARRPARVLVERDRVALLRDLADVDRRVGEHPGGVDRLRLVVGRGGRAELRHAALLHGRDVAAEQQRLVRLGGGVDDHRTAPLEQLRQFLAHLLAQLVVEIGERFIQQHETCVLDDGAGQGRALLLPAGKFRGSALQHRREPEKRRRLLDPALDLGPVEPLDAQRRGDVLEHRHVRIVDEELVDEADVALLRADAGDVLAVHHDPALGRRFEPGHQLHQRRLAGAGGAEQHVKAGLGERQRGAVDVRLAVHPLHDVPQLECHQIPRNGRQAGERHRRSAAARPADGAPDRCPGPARRFHFASDQRLTSSS